MYRRSNEDAGIGCVIGLAVIIFSLPFVGLFMMLNSKDEAARTGGATLIIIGVILLLFVFIAGAA